ncbi:MAG: hypothetical protein JW731_01815 [Bacteroidales bacterium]|nr:hypothetical protein [Bacteroidales bacterium]
MLFNNANHKNGLTVYLGVLVVTIGILLLTQCKSTPSEQTDWQKTQEKNTIEAYDTFLDKYPESENATKARTEITRILIAEAKTGNPIESYDEYIKMFPEGKNRSAFEPLIYEYLVAYDSAKTEEYVKRFPEGKYLGGFEEMIFENIKSGSSLLTFTEFLTRFPESNSKSMIDSMLCDSTLKYRNPALFDEYVNLFPKGKCFQMLDTIFEKELYNKAINSGSKKSFDAYLSRFSKNQHVKRIRIETVPSEQKVDILDNHDSIWKSVKSPANIYAIEGTSFKTVISNPEFKKDVLVYEVTAENKQSIQIKLKVPSFTIVSEDFSESKTSWTFSTNTNKSEVVNGLLRCSVKSNQYQKLENLNMDFNKNYELEIRFKIDQVLSPYHRSYCGIIWGEETKVKYFFISSQGRYSYGSQAQIINPENQFGYSGWDGFTETTDNWIKADNYNETDFNSLKIVKMGRQIKYFINDKYVHFENDMTKFRNSWAGYGLGNANIFIDYFNIEQYTD